MRSSYTDPLSWNLFRVVHGDAVEDQFEALCKDLFARRVEKSPAELISYASQPGIEVEPVSAVDNQHYSFQSKFSSKDTVNWSGFTASLNTTIEEKKTRGIPLDIIIYYTNGNAASTNATRDKINIRANESEIGIDWVYGEALLAMVNKPSNHDLRGKYFRGGKNLPLVIPTAPQSQYISAIKYQIELVPFHGRENEIDSLMNFANGEHNVAWTIVAGGGGLGKSRLALELCKRLHHGDWHAGFWTPGSVGDLQNWQPERDHFIVCDYLNDRDEEVIKLIQRADAIPAETHRKLKIRILLLDREAATASYKLCGAPIVGPSIAALYSGNTTIDLAPMSLNEVLTAIEKFARKLRLSKSFIKSLRKWTANVDDNRRLVLASLLCLQASEIDSEEENVDFSVIVQKVLGFERQRWASLDVDSNVQKVLLLATMLGGISRKGAILGTKANALLSAFKKDNVYETIVGESTEHQLAPLSHDLVGELFVLDSLTADATDDRAKFIEMTQIALDVDHGKGMVAFFTRAANDYPGHPTLGILRTPFSNVEPSFTVWFLIIANVIDKIPATAEEKLGLFEHAVHGILQSAPHDKKYLHILRGYFLRLLYSLTNDVKLAQWVGEYRIVDTGSEYPPSPTVPKKDRIDIGSQSVELLPKEYCNAVLKAFTNLVPTYKTKLASPHLLEVYSNALIHLSVTSSVDFAALETTFDMLFGSFGNLWMPGLASAATDTLATLVNFNHARQRPEEVRSFTYKVLNALDERPSFVGAAHCYSVASSVLRNTVIDLQEVQTLLYRFDLKFPTETIPKNETLATAYIGLAVAAMYGFKSETDYAIAHTRAKTALDLCHKFPSGKNVENATLSISQLLRYQGEFSSTDEKMEILDWVIQHASNYGSQHPKIVATIVGELSSRYGSSDTDPLVRNRLYQRVMDLIRYFRSTPLTVSVYPSGFFTDDLIAAFDNNDYDHLQFIAIDIAELQEIPYVDLLHLYSHITQEFLKQWNIIRNSGDISSITEVATVTQYWLDTLHDTTHVAPILNHIIDEFGSMNGN